jgi:hypothetical protein
VDDALAEIARLPGRHLYFLDDHLFGDVRFARELFRGMKGMGRVFQGAATVDSILRDDVIEEAAAALTGLPPALLGAIAKARRWINDLRQGRIASFEDIAKQEGQGERHIRLLAPLAFISPRIISAIVEGTAPAGVTVTGLARALPYSWAEQDHSVGLQ